MPGSVTNSMIRREIDGDKVCLLTFDRPESGANIFDAATLGELNEHVDLVEKDSSLRGLIIASAKKSIFIAGADLKTLLKQAQTGGLRRSGHAHWSSRDHPRIGSGLGRLDAFAASDWTRGSGGSDRERQALRRGRSPQARSC